MEVVEYHRGELTVLDRPGLEAAACDCFAADQQAYAELMRGCSDSRVKA